MMKRRTVLAGTAGTVPMMALGSMGLEDLAQSGLASVSGTSMGTHHRILFPDEGPREEMVRRLIFLVATMLDL